MTCTRPICPYCNTPARNVDSAIVYRGRSYGPIWLCSNYPDCDAYVGCHPGSNEPLGSLADGRLRAARKRAHASFDRLWKEAPNLYELPTDARQRRKSIKRIQKTARTRAYAWLCETLGIESKQCHIAHFDLDLCERTVSACQGITPEYIRERAKAREKVERDWEAAATFGATTIRDHIDAEILERIRTTARCDNEGEN